MKINTKQLAGMAMFCAIAYVLMVITHNISFMPSASYLKYDAKDIIIVIGGFIWGPLSALYISVIVSIIEFFTVSGTGWIGLIMNIISTCSFACTASIIYKFRRTISGAVIGLISGCLVVTAVMLLWNYLITPIYLVNTSRETVATMLLPVFLPFNLLKSGLNAGFAYLLYKPIINALRKAGLVAPVSTNKKTTNVGIMLFFAFIVITCILIILAMKDII